MSKNIMNKEEEYKTAMVQQAPENQEQQPENVEVPKEEFDLARTVGKVVLIALGVVALGAVGLLVAGAVSKKDEEKDSEAIDDDQEDTEDQEDDITNKIVEVLEQNGYEMKEKTDF